MDAITAVYQILTGCLSQCDYTKGQLPKLIDVIIEEKEKLFVCTIGVVGCRQNAQYWHPRHEREYSIVTAHAKFHFRF